MVGAVGDMRDWYTLGLKRMTDDASFGDRPVSHSTPPVTEADFFFSLFTFLPGSPKKLKLNLAEQV